MCVSSVKRNIHSYRYSNFNRVKFTVPFQVVDILNGWIRDAGPLYDHDNKPLVMRALNNLEVISSDVFIRNQESGLNNLRLASTCEVDKIDELTSGALGRILYYTFDEPFVFWNASLLALYELSDGWWDCRRQSLSSETKQTYNQTINRVIRKIGKWVHCFPSIQCISENNPIYMGKGNALKDLSSEIKSLCSLICIIKGGLQMMNNYIENSTSIDIEDVIKHSRPWNLTLDPLHVAMFENMLIDYIDLKVGCEYNGRKKNTENSLDEQNTNGEDCKLIIDEFANHLNSSNLPPLQCTGQEDAITNCEKEILSHNETIKIWKAELADLLQLLSSRIILNLIPQSKENAKLTNSGCNELVVEEKENKLRDLGGNIFLKIVSHAPVDGRWGTWSSWSKCSDTCQNESNKGAGVRIRRRNCNNPPPTNGGLDCSEVVKLDIRASVGIDITDICRAEEFEKHQQDNPTTGENALVALKNVQEQTCNIDLKCPKIDGNWSPWYPWSSCTKSCGTGTRRAIRYCNFPKPSSDPDGNQCPHNSSHRLAKDERLQKAYSPESEEYGNDEGSLQFDEKEETCLVDVCSSDDLEPEIDQKLLDDRFYERCSKLIDADSWSISRYQHCIQFHNDNEAKDDNDRKDEVEDNYKDYDLDKMEEVYSLD